MLKFISADIPRAFAAMLLLGFVCPVPSIADTENNTHITSLGPQVAYATTSTGNVVMSIGYDGALIVGTPSMESTSQISDYISSRTKSPLRYVVIMPQSVERSQGDAGWERRGALVAMQENALGRLGGHAMGTPGPLPAQLAHLGVDRPKIAFSAVLTFDLNGDSIHVIHQSPGYSDADALVHFHIANLVYAGEDFPGDGYPAIDLEQNGRVDGIIKTLESWTGHNVRIVPAHGEVVNGDAVQSYVEMLTTVRSHIQESIQNGQSESQVIAARPTAAFDAKWGHGRISPDVFVHEVYKSLALPAVKAKTM